MCWKHVNGGNLPQRFHMGGKERHGLADLEVNHNRLSAQAAVLAHEGGIHEQSIGRPQRPVSRMDMPENVDPWYGSEDRFQKLRAAFPALCTSAVVMQ